MGRQILHHCHAKVIQVKGTTIQGAEVRAHLVGWNKNEEAGVARCVCLKFNA